MKFLTNGFAYALIFQFLLGFSGLAFSQSISLTIQDAQREFWYLLSVGRKTEAQTLLAAFIPQPNPKMPTQFPAPTPDRVSRISF